MSLSVCLSLSLSVPLSLWLSLSLSLPLSLCLLLSLCLCLSLSLCVSLSVSLSLSLSLFPSVSVSLCLSYVVIIIAVFITVLCLNTCPPWTHSFVHSHVTLMVRFKTNFFLRTIKYYLILLNYINKYTTTLHLASFSSPPPHVYGRKHKHAHIQTCIHYK